MRYTLLIIYSSAIAAFTLFGETGLSFAGETANRLSVGYGSVTQPTDDPKAPAASLLTAKYGFKKIKGLTPYLGSGLAYTINPETKPGKNVTINTGIGGQAGLSYLLGENSLLNIDYNYLNLSPDTKHGDSPSQSIGVGVQIKF